MLVKTNSGFCYTNSTNKVMLYTCRNLINLGKSTTSWSHEKVAREIEDLVIDFREIPNMTFLLKTNQGQKCGIAPKGIEIISICH